VVALLPTRYGAIIDQTAVEQEKLLTNWGFSTYNKQVLRSFPRCLLAEITERKESLP
jgi:hypothetical protein